MPLPSTKVIHPRWSDHHAPVPAGAMTATCTAYIGGEGSWDPVNGATPGETTPLYVGPCRAQALNRSAGEADSAGQPVVEHPYLVVINRDAAELPIGTRVLIDTCPDDPQLVGKVLTVADITMGSLRWERDLLCDLDITNQPEQS